MRVSGNAWGSPCQQHLDPREAGVIHPRSGIMLWHEKPVVARANLYARTHS
ncbi:hypothetical protein HMPREF0742_02053 [Rothia aeria F0184]|uniref:Uncharacterized protein n=1 Tax=Rothia aeria F0184 TaxID=888019 RepID=U7V1D5_9MICC|nr:hypothetical protein HMPREF0742_02053 [Rothia aeria F0184]